MVIEHITVVEDGDELDISCEAEFSKLIKPRWSEVLRLFNCSSLNPSQLGALYDSSLPYRFNIEVSYSVNGTENVTDDGWINTRLWDLEIGGFERPCITRPAFDLDRTRSRAARRSAD